MDRLAAVTSRLRTGTLPTDKPIRMWAGHGNGRPCDGCGERITAKDIERELDLPAERVLRFHVECEGYWRSETGN